MTALGGAWPETVPIGVSAATTPDLPRLFYRWSRPAARDDPPGGV